MNAMILDLPNATSGSVVIEHAYAMFPSDIAVGVRHLSDDTFQFYCGPRFVEFVWNRQTPLVDNLYPRN